MSHISPIYTPENIAPSKVAIFLSGNGTNAEKILDRQRDEDSGNYVITVLVTDRPEQSKARHLAKIYDVSLIENDIRTFYYSHGCKKMTLATEEGRKLREEWTSGVIKQLKPFDVDFGLFAGFIPLTNITAEFPCLNVHPGDLTYTKNGKRYLVGLHTIPVERAILDDLQFLRSSVIIAEPYGQSEENMDSGPILGMSEKVRIDLMGEDLGDLKRISEFRPKIRPRSGYRDRLEEIALANLDELKKKGDWILFPQVVSDFARGRFGLNQTGDNYYKTEDGNWTATRTVEYGKNRKTLI